MSWYNITDTAESISTLWSPGSQLDLGDSLESDPVNSE